MSNFEVIKGMTLDELANYMHNTQESTIETGVVEDETHWKMFLSKEAANGVPCDE